MNQIRIPVVRPDPWGPNRDRTYTIDMHNPEGVGWCLHVQGNATLTCHYINRTSGEIRVLEGLRHEMKVLTKGTCKRYTPVKVEGKI